MSNKKILFYGIFEVTIVYVILLDIFVKGENLLAQRYEINAGYPMPKATFMGGINVNF